MVLRNKYLCRSDYFIKEEDEIDLKMRTKKKVDEIEELKEGVDRCEFQIVKTLEDLHFLKHEEIAAIAKIELELIRSGISKELISFLKKSIIPKKYLPLVSGEQLKNIYNV